MKANHSSVDKKNYEKNRAIVRTAVVSPDLNNESNRRNNKSLKIRKLSPQYNLQNSGRVSENLSLVSSPP